MRRVKAALDLELEQVVEQRADEHRAQRGQREPAHVANAQRVRRLGLGERRLPRRRRLDVDLRARGRRHRGEQQRRKHEQTADAPGVGERCRENAAEEPAHDPSGADDPEDPLRLARVRRAVGA